MERRDRTGAEEVPGAQVRRQWLLHAMVLPSTPSLPLRGSPFSASQDDLGVAAAREHLAVRATDICTSASSVA